MYSSDELFQRSREGYFGAYFPSCEATGKINTKNNTYIIFHFLHSITNP